MEFYFRNWSHLSPPGRDPWAGLHQDGGPGGAKEVLPESTRDSRRMPAGPGETKRHLELQQSSSGTLSGFDIKYKDTISVTLYADIGIMKLKYQSPDFVL